MSLVWERTLRERTHYLRSKREGRFERAGSSLSKWLVVAICEEGGSAIVFRRIRAVES